MAVNTQSITELYITSNLSSKTINMMTFLWSFVHSEETGVVNTTFSCNPHIQTTGNNMSAVNQSTTSNISVPQGNRPIPSAEVALNTLVLPYNNDQPANLNLWDSLFALTSLLKVDKFHIYDTQNITCSLIYIETFIKQCLLGNKPTKNFSDLAKVGIATWYLINAICELGWDKLSANDNKKKFNIVYQNTTDNKLYAQVSKINIEDII